MRHLITTMFLILLATTALWAGGSTEALQTTTAATMDAPTTDTLVLYFSATGNTKRVAEEIAKQTGGSLLEIVPKVSYTSADLNYNDKNCRANQEMDDPSSRPETTTVIDSFASYDTIFLGYPIWWGTMPRIINTILESYDFANKTIIPFCTSGSSGISTSISEIRKAVPKANVQNGMRLRSASDVASFLANLK